MAKIRAVKSRNHATIVAHKRRVDFQPKDATTYGAIRVKKEQPKNINNIVRFDCIH